MASPAAGLISLTLRLIASTVRLREVDRHHLDGLRASGSPFLFAVWHGRMLLPIWLHRNQGIAAMVSLSRDGDLAAAVLQRLGYASVRGSSSRGGNQAYHAMLAALESGRPGAVIPDGPRGPARELKPGIVRLAAQVRVPILPLSCSARPRVLLRSWDRFLLPAPMSRAVVTYGKPVDPGSSTADREVERIRLALERCLTELERAADASLGIAATTSAEPATTWPARERNP